MQRPRFQLRNFDLVTFALIFAVSFILYMIPYLKDLLIIVAISAVLYTFVKSQF
jgi:hypothetical protein